MNEREPRRYEMRRYIADALMRQSDGRLISEYLHVEMRAAFDRIAADEGLPDGAAPRWCLTWEYEDDGERYEDKP